jgi:ADP-heptose:LPS heptosyltransferase
MFERLYTYCGMQFARFQFRSEIEPPRTMTSFLRNAKYILITLPIGYEEANAASDALQTLRDRLEHAHLTLVHTGTRATSLTGSIRCDVVRLDPLDINRFSLPSRSLLKRIGTHPYDVAIDLNLDFVLHTAYICRATSAGVRVGFVRDTSETFFNVQIRTVKRTTPKATYDKLAATLAMF